MGPKTRANNKNSPSNGASNYAANEHDDPAANAESFQFITSSQLEKILEDNRNEIRDAIKSELSDMKSEIVRLQGELESVTGIANNSQKLVEQLQTKVTKLEEENGHLKHKLQNTVNDQHASLEKIEECKNRQLRKTIVFRGIPEKNFPSETTTNNNTDSAPSPRPENWDETAVALAESMSQTLPNTTFEQASKMVERCHRSKPNPRYKGSGPRPIFAAFMDWRDSELVKASYRKNSNNNVFAEQKVGPRTTARRNMALKLRRELLDEKRITSAYVAFPARLMTKDSSARGAKYTCFKDFSDEAVNLR